MQGCGVMRHDALEDVAGIAYQVEPVSDLDRLWCRLTCAVGVGATAISADDLRSPLTGG
jgi:hypothetical protein